MSNTVPIRQPQEYNMKNPRPTKASLIRLNLNKPTSKEFSKKQANRLAANFNKNKNFQQTKLSKADVLKQVDQFIQQQNKNVHTELEWSGSVTNNSEKHEESLPRLPVEIRQEINPDLPNKSLSVILEPTYCPENYSDFEDRFESVEESFHIPSTTQKDSPCSSSTISENTFIEQHKGHDTPRMNKDSIKHGGVAKDIDKHQILKKLENLQLDKEVEGDISSEKLEKLNRSEETEDLYQLLYKQQTQLLALEKQVYLIIC